MYRGLAQAISLGALHGSTTFLPISRGGHLALVEMLFDFDAIGRSEEMGMVLGTFVATLIVVWHAVANVARASVRAVIRPSTLKTTHEGRDLTTVILAQLPTAMLWLLLGDGRDTLGRQPLLVAIGFLFTTVVLLSSAWAGRGERIQPTWVHALLIGVAQGIALFPGISRIGCTIATAMWLGMTERRSFELSILVSIPALIGSLVQLRAGMVSVDFSPLGTCIAAGVTLLTGVGAAGILRALVVRGQMAWFSMWVAPLAIATFAFARAWPDH
jgi:undecaprenyl-diphosphatase